MLPAVIFVGLLASKFKSQGPEQVLFSLSL